MLVSRYDAGCPGSRAFRDPGRLDRQPWKGFLLELGIFLALFVICHEPAFLPDGVVKSKLGYLAHAVTEDTRRVTRIPGLEPARPGAPGTLLRQQPFYL